MQGLFQPSHLVFILIIVLILFGPGKLPEIGNRIVRAHLDWRGQWSNLRGALFMAKGVDPAVGRDVGDMLPDADAHRSSLWFISLLAVLVGNTLYFLSSPFFPPAARMHEASSPGLPVLVDLWFCIFAFGVLGLFASRHRPNKPQK